MSASSSRFPGHHEPAMPASAYDQFDEPVTGRPTGPATHAPVYTDATHTIEPTRELRAPARSSDRGRKMKVTAPVVPPASVTGRSLTLVIAIMCFLACLTAGAVWMIKELSDAWTRDIASEVTVQITPQENSDIEKSIADVVSYLEKQRGIANAKALSLDEFASLLEPWLGTADALKSLPVPRLIAVEVNRNDPPDLTEIGTALGRDFKGVSLDDHRRWQHQIRAVTRSFALGGIAILALVAAATTAIIVSATRSAMASNREIVEVLHFVGATDKFISREFEKHFLQTRHQGRHCRRFACHAGLHEHAGHHGASGRRSRQRRRDATADRHRGARRVGLYHSRPRRRHHCRALHGHVAGWRLPHSSWPALNGMKGKWARAKPQPQPRSEICRYLSAVGKSGRGGGIG